METAKVDKLGMGEANPRGYLCYVIVAIINDSELQSAVAITHARSLEQAQTPGFPPCDFVVATATKEHLPSQQELQSSQPHAEPGILEFQKVHFKVLVCHFVPTRNMAPQSQLNSLKSAVLGH